METVIAKNTYRVPGSRVMIVKGRTYGNDDPMVKAHPDLFATPDGYAAQEARPASTADLGRRSMSARAVETARQAPGEKRDIDFACDECDFVGKNRKSLSAHQRSHQ